MRQTKTTILEHVEGHYVNTNKALSDPGKNPQDHTLAHSHKQGAREHTETIL